MGAGVAASPHCPIAAGYQAWEARQSAGRFRGSDPSRGLESRSSGVLPALARLSVSPRAPRQGRSPGGSPLGRSGTVVPNSRRRRRRSRSSVPPPAGKPWPKPQPCLAGHGLASSSCRFAAPGPKPGPARQVRGRGPFLAGGSAATCVPQLPDRLKPKPVPVLELRTRRSGTWALHEACRFRIR
jgi:hypothetical protein